MLLYLVFVDESVDNFAINVSSKIFVENNFFVYFLLGLQIIFAPLQAGFSDYYLRKRSLIISVVSTLLSVVLFKFALTYSFLLVIFAISIKGIMGNSMPIAWAGIADETRNNNFRFALALSICAIDNNIKILEKMNTLIHVIEGEQKRIIKLINAAKLSADPTRPKILPAR